MKSLTYAEKSAKMLEETIDALRNKPVLSSFLESRFCQGEASALYKGLPQPLYMGYCMNYILEKVSCPVSPNDILVGRFVEKVPDEEEEKHLWELWDLNQAKELFMKDGGHTTLDCEEILRLGLTGYIEKTEQALQQRIADGSEKERLIFLQGMSLVYRSYRRYIIRYAQACEEAGMEEAAAVCRHLSDNPPSTFLEAIQLVLFVTSIYSMYSAAANATLTCGRLDDLLAPYYEKDLAEGRLTREDAGYIIDDFNCKSAIILGRGEHQMSDGNDTGWWRNTMYDSPTYVILGGRSNHRDHLTNPLTRLFLERIHPRLENPVYVFRRTNDVTPDIWRLVCDKLRQNSTLLVYNDETCIPSMINAGVDPQDAVNYTIHGCNWPDIQGKSVMMVHGGPIPRMIMTAMFDENMQLLQDFPDIDSIYQKVGSDWRMLIREVYNEQRKQKGAYPATEPLRCIDCFTRGTIENATNSYNGTEYIFRLNLLRNIGTAADMMAALENTVYAVQNPVPLSVMANALKSNFVGNEDLWKRCKNSPKYGRDDDAADKHAVRLMTMLTDIVKEESINPETGIQDIFSPSVTITDMGHIGEGKRMGATPDGRLAEAPLSENLSPSLGASQSVTALLNSVAKLPFERISSGALNLRMPKALVNGDEGLANLMVILETYFEDGGMQIQLSVADTAELKDAQLHPEKYPDLMVRITGYSAVFVDMCKSAQDVVIKRDELA